MRNAPRSSARWCLSCHGRMDKANPKTYRGCRHACFAKIIQGQSVAKFPSDLRAHKAGCVEAKDHRRDPKILRDAGSRWHLPALNQRRAQRPKAGAARRTESAPGWNFRKRSTFGCDTIIGPKDRFDLVLLKRPMTTKIPKVPIGLRATPRSDK